MTPYFNTLPPAVQSRLSPLLPVMRETAAQYGLPVDTFIALAAHESGGRNTVGDRSLKNKAHGIYQVRDAQYWLGGADPMNPVAATRGLGRRLKLILDECNGDQACLHYKYMAGPGRSYTPQAVARTSARYPHVGPRLEHVRQVFSGNAAPGGASNRSMTLQAGQGAPAGYVITKGQSSAGMCQSGKCVAQGMAPDYESRKLLAKYPAPANPSVVSFYANDVLGFTDDAPDMLMGGAPVRTQPNPKRVKARAPASTFLSELQYILSP